MNGRKCAVRVQNYAKIYDEGGGVKSFIVLLVLYISRLVDIGFWGKLKKIIM